ncbi:MAG: amidohydrolase family protein [Clostridia bacterium]|nr:amidohydrolase family protein [Clostridia bacterium]
MEEIIIRGGTVIDGTGQRAYRADVAVNRGVITAVGDLGGLAAQKELDASGLAVSPGFIDAHAHSDTSFLRDSSSASKLYQGITTEISGQCGSSPFPRPVGYEGESSIRRSASFEEFLRRFEEEGHEMAVNQALMVGHGSLRAAVLGYEDRAPDADELESMKALLRRDLEAGAWGMSLGLEYSPGCFSGADELSELGKVVREYDGLIPCHMRSEGLNIDAALDELLNVGRASGARVHVSHLKLDNFRVHGRAKEVWAKLEQAKKDGVRVSADLYPFLASCTTLNIRCPKWSLEGGDAAVVQHLNGPGRAEIIESIRYHYFNAERAETCLINDDDGCWPEIVGKTLRFIAEEYLHTNDYAEAAAEILIRTNGAAGGIFFVMSEEDMLYFLSQDTGIGSDGWALPGDPALLDSKPHPRSYAAVSEFFRLAREKNICLIEEAVRRVTSKAADMIGMKDRGRLLPGMAADIAVFDPDTIGPAATYLDPVKLSRGVRHVLVNGRIALHDGVQTEVRAGKFLRKPRAQSIY